MSGLRSAERKGAEQLFAALDWVPVGERVARQAAELGRRYRRSHQGIGATDLVVGASAIVMNATLATLNVRHYPMFPGLQPPY